jgi:hypothetical protein
MFRNWSNLLNLQKLLSFSFHFFICLCCWEWVLEQKVDWISEWCFSCYWHPEYSYQVIASHSDIYEVCFCQMISYTHLLCFIWRNLKCSPKDLSDLIIHRFGVVNARYLRTVNAWSGFSTKLSFVIYSWTFAISYTL